MSWRCLTHGEVMVVCSHCAASQWHAVENIMSSLESWHVCVSYSTSTCIFGNRCWSFVWIKAFKTLLQLLVPIQTVVLVFFLVVVMMLVLILVWFLVLVVLVLILILVLFLVPVLVLILIVVLFLVLILVLFLVPVLILCVLTAAAASELINHQISPRLF